MRIEKIYYMITFVSNCSILYLVWEGGEYMDKKQYDSLKRKSARDVQVSQEEYLSILSHERREYY